MWIYCSISKFYIFSRCISVIEFWVNFIMVWECISYNLYSFKVCWGLFYHPEYSLPWEMYLLHLKIMYIFLLLGGVLINFILDCLMTFLISTILIFCTIIYYLYINFYKDCLSFQLQLWIFLFSFISFSFIYFELLLLGTLIFRMVGPREFHFVLPLFINDNLPCSKVIFVWN